MCINILHAHDGPGVDVTVASELNIGIGLLDHTALRRRQTGRWLQGLARRCNLHVAAAITAHVDRDLPVVDKRAAGARHPLQRLPGMDLVTAMRVLRFQEDRRALVSHLIRYRIEAGLNFSRSDLSGYITSGDRLLPPQSGSSIGTTR